MSEYFDIRNWDGTLTGEKKERSLVHRDGDIHGTSHIWIYRKNKKTGSADILLQKRAKDKDAFPGCYDTSSAGHIPAGGDFLESALRELYEELGVEAGPEELHFLFFHRQTIDTQFYGQRFYDRQVSAIYVLERDLPEEQFRLQAEEVESVRWMDCEQCKTCVENKNPLYCIHPDEYGQVYEYIKREVLTMDEKQRNEQTEPEKKEDAQLSPTWNEDCLTELDEWIESQGIYLRQ